MRFIIAILFWFHCITYNLRMNTITNRPIELVTFSTLYPNSDRPHHGIFVEHQLRHLISAGDVNPRVVAPVPWFPFSAPFFGRYASFAKVMPRETRESLVVEHPRYLLLPKIVMGAAPGAMASACYPVLRRLQQERDFDLIDAHY